MLFSISYKALANYPPSYRSTSKTKCCPFRAASVNNNKPKMKYAANAKLFLEDKVESCSDIGHFGSARIKGRHHVVANHIQLETFASGIDSQPKP